MMLEIIAGNGRGRKYDLSDNAEVLLGRDPEADIRIEDIECSRRHALISSKDGRFSIEDLGSRNGLFINRARCSKALLDLGDEIRIGHTTLRVGGIGVPPRGTSLFKVHEGGNSVLVALPHDQADLLNRASAPVVFGEIERENAILRQLCEISQIAAGNTDPQTTLVMILDRVRSILQTDTACILTLTAEGDWAVRAVSNPGQDTGAISVSRTIVQQTIREGVAILAADPLTDPRFSASQSILVQSVASAICSPLKVGDDFAGVLFLDRRNNQPTFTALDLRFAATVGNLLSMLIETEQLQIEARRRERLATIGEVMAELAHCIKNIITALWFSADTLKVALNAGKYDIAGECLEILTNQTQRISDLVLDMLSYTKERVPVRTEIDLRSVAEKSAVPFRQELERNGIQFQVTVAADCPRIRAEDSALQRVFHNLLLNAIEAITAKAAGTGREILVAIRPLPDSKNVEIRFRDTGNGIPAAQLGDIFDAFFSTKGAKGTGLGLAVARKIVVEHGGRITVDSRENEWTEFRITLPVHAEETPDKAPPAQAGEAK